MNKWQPAPQPAVKTKTELREILAEAVRNTQPAKRPNIKKAKQAQPPRDVVFKPSPILKQRINRRKRSATATPVAELA